MKRYAPSVLAFGLVLGLGSTSVLAYDCPNLVTACQALVGKMEKRAGSDMAKVAEAKKGCEQAQKLHAQGDHKGSVVKAGDSIALAGQAAK
jgi:hypothetical protein